MIRMSEVNEVTLKNQMGGNLSVKRGSSVLSLRLKKAAPSFGTLRRIITLLRPLALDLLLQMVGRRGFPLLNRVLNLVKGRGRRVK